MSVWAKQTLAILASVVVAGVMLLLGLWQMASYEESTHDVSAERAAAPPIALADQVSADGTVQDVYARRVTVTGEYLPEHQVLVGVTNEEGKACRDATGSTVECDVWRVATAFRLTDGRTVAVVRGAVEPGSSAPAPPTGEQSLVGVFLAPDKAGADTSGGPNSSGDHVGAPDHPTLRVQELAQTWPSPLIGGYITLSSADSVAQGLTAAPLVLPEAEGSPTHRGYALQWWVFAAGAVAFGIYAARGFAKQDERQRERIATTG